METILLVDDEKIVIEVGQAVLQELGYEVEIARSGAEAIETIKKRGPALDLVILDMIMPGMDGGRTFDLMRKIQPDIKVLLSSGYAIDGEATEIMNRGCDGFIQKPFRLQELSQKVRQVLESGGT
jgi:CheY-like chemotaxis protein